MDYHIEIEIEIEQRQILKKSKTEFFGKISI